MKYLKLTFTFSIISFIAICFSACEKDSDNNTELYWQTTKCKDPWHQESVLAESQAYIDNMEIYLTGKGFIFSGIRLRDAGTADNSSCVGCGCKLAQRLSASFDNGDVDKAKAIGFTEN